MTDTPLLYDWAGKPTPATGQTQAFITNRQAAALYSPQGGMVQLGSDYGSAPLAQVPKVDASGSQYVVPSNPAGGAAQVYTGQAAPAAVSQYGNLTMARQDSPTPSTYYPLNLDMNMALNVHHRSKVTFRAIATGVTAAANKSILALVNNSSMVMRINECSVYVPPSGAGGTGLLGGSANSTYYPVICELRRIATYTGGTSVAAISGDTADSLASGVTLATGATASATISTFHRMDAVVATGTGLPWYGRGDHNEKTFVVRPGEGFSVTCISSGTINNANGSGTTTAVLEIELTFTQAVA